MKTKTARKENLTTTNDVNIIIIILIIIIVLIIITIINSKLTSINWREPRNLNLQL